MEELDELRTRNRKLHDLHSTLCVKLGKMLYADETVEPTISLFPWLNMVVINISKPGTQDLVYAEDVSETAINKIKESIIDLCELMGGSINELTFYNIEHGPCLDAVVFNSPLMD